MEKVSKKESNRFKFIPFSERISNVNIDVFHRVPHRFEEESAEQFTYFHLALRKWTVLNLTGKWKEFRKEIGYETQTLPQLLNNKEKIVNVFLKNIRLQNELSLQPVLELMVAFVKDLRHEFYPFYPQVLKELLHLLNYRNPDVLEYTFTCLAYIFKYLFRELVKDLDMVLLDLSTLLSENNPDYVRDFAAQSFSFVARKVKDKNKLLSLVLYAVQTSPQASVGCGQLLFEMMKGIKGQTHSCANELFSVLFNSLGKKDVPQKILFPLTNQIVTTYGNNISPQYSILFKVLIEVLKTKLQNEDYAGLKKLLKITVAALNCRGGAHLNETSLPEMVSILIKSLSLEIKIVKLAAGVCANMLNLKNLKLPQEFASRIISKVMQVRETTVLLQFISETSNSIGFEGSILPRALQSFAPLNSVEFLQVLTRIAVEKTSRTTDQKFEDFVLYPVTLHSSTLQIYDLAIGFLKNGDDCKENWKNVLCSLILIRHLEPINRSSVVSVVVKFVDKLIESLKSSHENKLNILFVLCVALETLLHFKDSYVSDSDGIEADWFCQTLLKILENDKSILALKAFDLFLTLHRNSICSDEVFSNLYETIQDWLPSSQTNSRLLALHSLQKLEEFKSKESSMVKLLQHALDAEFVPLTVTDYRNKIMLLQKLNFEGLGCLEEEKHKILLKYLLGVFYCNFQLLWDPVSHLIASFSVGMQVNTFWEVFFSQLRTATAHCKGMASAEDYHLPDDLDLYLLESVTFVKAEDKADHENYRNLMWTTMSLFPNICETKNVDVISIYLPFIENEILKTSVEHNLTMNIKKNDTNVSNPENIDEVPAEDSKNRSSYTNTIKCAVSQLTVLSKFKNPKQCHREPEVRKSFLALLVHRDVEIQKKALECMFAYKFSYMAPYKQILLSLIDEGKFKDKLVHFQVDMESGAIKDVHREELMPIVMRILYGKMLFQSSTRRGNKSSANMTRRSIILRFLAGISHSEMETFFKMAFKKWNSYCESDVFEFEKIINSVDLERVPLLKKLQSTVNLAETVLNSFGGLMSHHLQRFILKVLFSVGSYVSGLLAKRDQIYAGYLLSLKNIKTSCVDFMTKFFDRFPRFPWREDDINALFHIFIWPNIEKLPIEGVHGPTALLRLFRVWSNNPRYFKLLARYDGKNEKMTILPFVLELLLKEKADARITSFIGSMLENLLTLDEEEPMEVDDDVEELLPLDIEYILPIDETGIAKLTIKEQLNYGSKILFPHVGTILTYLRRNLEKSDPSAFGKGQMTVLSRISEIATSAEHGDALMSLLIKLMGTRKKTKVEDDVLINMATTIENLTNVVTNPSGYLRQLAVLFGTIELKQAREILINTVANMERRCPELNQTATIIRELNAWDSKRVDQPDFDKRLNSLKKVKSLANEGNLDVDLAFIFLHNCFYFVSCEPDISLRESSSYYLKEICPKVSFSLKGKKLLRQQWIESILNLVKNKIVSENENVQTLSISLLGVMARECGDLHPVLKDLSVLTNKLDLEVDFFENVQHLQIYRRLRALQKFSTVAKTLKKPPLTRTLVQFILPLATRYLACAKYAGKNSLIDSAIEAVATICKFLPWHQYQTILRFYIAKLRSKIEFQKQLTRIVIAILDSFHFDISHSPMMETVKANELTDQSNNNETFEEEKENHEPKAQKINQADKASEEKKQEQWVNGKNVVEKVENEEDEEEDKKEEDEKEKIKKNEGKADGEEQKGEETENLIEGLEEGLEKKAEEEQEEEENENQEDKFAIDSITVLKPNAASKVEKVIGTSLLEQLHKIMTRKSQIESTHKVNFKNLSSDMEEEDLLKVPIALTLVKLLQKLPERMLNTHLPGIFMRLCTFLKSRLESIRRVTRETLQQILFTLGPKFLPLLLSEMSASLTKGFQVHVLVYTIHAVIHHILDLLQPGDIDANLPTLLEACKSDLFGALSEEKEVVKIQAQHKEAKSTKSYHLINLIAQRLTEKCLTDLILPVKEVLQTSYSHKNIVKCREYLRQVTLGLSSNQFISYENLFIYIYGTTSESIPELMPEPREPPKKKNPKEQQDCFIIPPEPRSRSGALSNPVKKSSKSNAHIIIEFGFGLLHTVLKKDKLKHCDRDIRCFLDPIAPILIKSLESQNVKVSTLALQCLTKFVKYHLPSVKGEMKKITDSLFSILHKFAAAGLSKGNNFDLVLAAFKAMSVLIRETDYHGITAEQLKILLLYTEQDIYDNSRQATAFTLLRTILKKKLESPVLDELMKKVASLSITSELVHVRQQARQNVFQYIMDYPLKSKVEDFIGFFTSQLNFARESGRQSSLEMIKNFILHFPTGKLEELSGVFLLTLGASLVNDDSSNCKKIISGLIKAMLTRLDKAHRDQLFDVLMVWLEEEKLTHRRLGAQIAGIFVSVEKEEFKERLPKLLPIMQKQFMGDSIPGQFVRLPTNNADEDRLKDNHYFQVLQLALKICSNYPDFLTSEKYQENVYFLTEIAQSFLCHSHEWIRFAGAQFLGHVFNSCEPNEVAAVLNGQRTELKLSFLEPVTIHRRIKSLILDHCAQFIPGIEINQEFLDQATKNLVYLGRVLGGVSDANNENEDEENDDLHEDDEDESEKPKLTLLWMTKRMRRIVNMELGQNPNSQVLRMAVLRWTGAIAMCIPRPVLKSVLYHLMAPVVREREYVDTQQKENTMKELVLEVCGVLKKKVGVEAYTKEAVKIKTKLMERRAARKSKRAEEFITDPERAAKRKIERQKKKKEARKRKLERIKESKGSKFKKRRKNDYND